MDLKLFKLDIDELINEFTQVIRTKKENSLLLLFNPYVAECYSTLSLCSVNQVLLLNSKECGFQGSFHIYLRLAILLTKVSLCSRCMHIPSVSYLSILSIYYNFDI